MNWYQQTSKLAFKPETFDDKNVLNNKIHTYERYISELSQIADIVFQDQRFCKQKIQEIMKDKGLESLDIIYGKLSEANDACLDNPWTVSELSREIAYLLNQHLSELIKDRDSFSDYYKKELEKKGLWKNE